MGDSPLQRKGKLPELLRWSDIENVKNVTNRRMLRTWRRWWKITFMRTYRSHDERRSLRLRGSHSWGEFSFVFRWHAQDFTIGIRLYLFLENRHGNFAGFEDFLPCSGACVLLDDFEGPKDVVLSFLVFILKRLWIDALSQAILECEQLFAQSLPFGVPLSADRAHSCL